MCGIVGIASNEGSYFPDHRRKLVRELLYSDMLRGADSTGMFTVNDAEHAQVQLYKRAYPAPDFLELTVAKRLLNNMTTNRLVVGHNRHATIGGVNDYYAHPFEFENVVGVHNGTLDRHQHLPGGIHTSDSQQIFAAINEVGIKDCVEDFEGAFALVWYDKKEDTLNLLRNKERPLSIGTVENADNTKTIIFGSESKMLDWVADRNLFYWTNEPADIPIGAWIKINRKTLDIEREDIQLARPKAVGYGFHSTVGKGTSKVVESPVTQKEKLAELGLEIGDKIPVQFLNFQKKRKESKHGLFRGTIINANHLIVVEAHGFQEDLVGTAENWEGTVSGLHTSQTGARVVHVHATMEPLTAEDLEKWESWVCGIAGLEEDDLDTDVPFDEADEPTGFQVRGPHNSWISMSKFKQLTKDGCAHCMDPIYSYEVDDVVWDDNGEVLCYSCAKIFNLTDEVGTASYPSLQKPRLN